MSNDYQIHVNREKRGKTDYIIIMHANNLIMNGHIPTGSMILGSNKFTWGKWQEYLIDWGNKRKLPNHYFVELLDKDYVVFKGLQDNKSSYFLEEQVENLTIDRKYRNSILVVIGDNYSVSIPETRLLDHLSDKVIVPLMKDYNLDWSRVMYYDECLTESFINNESLKSRFAYEPMMFFDMGILRNHIAKYDKY